MRQYLEEERMKRIVSFIIAVLLSSSLGLGLGYSEEKDIKTNADDSTGQGKKSPASEQKIKKVSLEKAKKIVAAKVNGADITLDTVIVLASRLDLRMTHAHSTDAPSVKEIQSMALDRLIVQELAYQKAKALGIKADQKAIDTALAEIRTRAGSQEAYRKSLDQDAVTEERLRTQVEKTLMLESIYKQEVLDKISVPEEKITEEYEKNKDSFTQPEKISVVDVFISVGASDKGAETMAEDILKKIRENGDDPKKLTQDNAFVVREYEPKRDSSNDKVIYETARTLNPGEISSVLKTGDGLHIIKLVEYKPQKVHTFAEVKGLIENKLRNDAQNQKTQEWFAGLKKDAKIEIFVHEGQVPQEQTPK